MRTRPEVGMHPARWPSRSDAVCLCYRHRHRRDAMHAAMTRGAFACEFVLAAICAVAVGCNERALVQRGAEPDTHATTGESCLTIVSWNDLHGTIEPDRAMLDGTRVPAGGIVALADEGS